jgi:hypothetical protein
MSSPIWITPAGNIGTVTEGNPFSFILSASNDAGLPFTYTLISGQLPPGLALDTPTGSIYGNVPLLLSGDFFEFTVRATNLDGISDRTFNIAVTQDAITWNTLPNLGTVIHESYFSLFISATDPGNNQLTYEMISGQLPSGLIFESNGRLSGYINSIFDTLDTFMFTIKAIGATTSTQTFTLNVTSLGVHSPQWNTISAYNLGNGLEGGNLGNLFNNVPYSFQLKSVKPTPGGPGPITYTLISGFFPPGISMSSSGFISGTLSTQVVSTYPLYIQISDGLNSVTAVFYMKTNFVDTDLLYWVVNDSTIPVDLSLMNPGDSESFNIGLNSYKIIKNSGQTTFDQTLINQIVLKNDLSQSDSFIVVMIGTGIYSVYENYSGQIYNNFTLESITPGEYIFDLGSVDIGQPCVFKVTGISLSAWVRYEIISGSLPTGLNLDINTGDIEGSIQVQSTGSYDFTLRVYNYTLFQDLEFSMEITLPLLSFRPNKLTVRIPELGKIDWYNLLDLNLIPAENLYRPADINFGENTIPEVSILSSIDNLSVEEVYEALSSVIPTTLYPEDFIYVPVTDENSNVVCEALLLKLRDNFRRSDISYQIPVEKNPAPNLPVTLYPGGLEAIRQTFINSDNANNSLENWMNYYFHTNLIENQFIVDGILPDFYLGDQINFHNQILPNPFENDITYYVIPTSPTTFRLADSLFDAQNGNYIPFNVNESINRSGTLQFYFPALPIAYVKTGTGSALMVSYNNQQNIVPFGYYTLGSSSSFIDVFFTTLYGHNLNTGDPIQFLDLPISAPFVYEYIYYVIVVNAMTFKLAMSEQDAINDNAITITNNIDDRTNMPLSGSFKKLLLTNNNTIIVNEANTRFFIPVESVYIDNKFKRKPFTATSSNQTFNLPGHNLEEGSVVEFENQLNMSFPFINDQVYYAIIVDENNFQLALTFEDAENSTAITFSPNFSGYLILDTAKMAFINTTDDFYFSAAYTDSRFESTQTSPFELGDIVQLVQKTTTSFPSPFATITNYYVIPLSNGNSFRLADSLVNAQNNNYITFSSNFIGYIQTMSNSSEYNWRI